MSRLNSVGETWLTADEVARKLKLNKVTVLRWIRSGRLPAVNLGGTSGYRLRADDVEALLWTEYGGMRGYLYRASRALFEAAEAATEYANRFSSLDMARRGRELHEQAAILLQEAEHFRDVQSFYRPGSPPASLRELQPFMAAAYDLGNDDFKVVAVMVRDAIGDPSLPSSLQAVQNWLAKAEASNPPDTDTGRLVRIAGPLLLDRFHRAATN